MRNAEPLWSGWHSVGRLLKTLFSQSDKIDLWYEDLVAGFETEIQHIEDWLGIDRRPLVPRTVRQVSRPMHEVIANYADLRPGIRGDAVDLLFRQLTGRGSR